MNLLSVGPGWGFYKKAESKVQVSISKEFGLLLLLGILDLLDQLLGLHDPLSSTTQRAHGL